MNAKLVLIVFIAALPACCMRKNSDMKKSMPKKKIPMKKPMMDKKMKMDESMPMEPMAAQVDMPRMPSKQERMRTQQPMDMGAGEPMMIEEQGVIEMDDSGAGMQELNQIMDEMGGVQGAQ